MREELKLSQAIERIIIIGAVVAILLIWPIRAFSEEASSLVPREDYQVSQAVTPEANVMQTYIPAHKYTDKIQILVDSLGTEEGKFMFHFYDKDLTLLWEADRSFEGMEQVSYYTFPIKMELHQGELYYYTLDYIDTPFAVCFDEKQDAVQSDNGIFYYALEEVPGCTAITQYHYITDFTVKKILFLDTIIICITLLLLAAVFFFFRITALDRQVKTNRVIHAVLGALVIAATLFAAWQAGVEKIFNQEWVDIVVYLIGILLCGITLFYAVMRIRVETIQVNREILKKKLPNYLQTLFFALVILSCCNFVNAGSDYAQGLALREVCFFFALAIICMFEKKELWNIWNLIYAILAVVAGIFYCRIYEGTGEPYETAVRTAMMVGVWGIVILSALCNLVRKKTAKLAFFYTGFLTLFFILLVVFRNANVWELAVVIPFSLLYIRQIKPEKMSALLKNIANGVVLSFVVLTGQSLLHRPFHYYMRIRYSGMFITVTVTAVYLVLLFAVAVNKLLVAYDKNKGLQGIWKELILLGVVCGYQFLTLSRTGIMTCVGVFLVAIGLYILVHYKKRPKLLKNIAYTFLAVLWFIPIVFTATRMIPAISNDPLIYEGELFLDSIKKGEPINSFRYISVPRFLGLSTERILGKPDLNQVTQSGKTVEEAIKEAANQEENADEILKENGVTVKEGEISYVDIYGSEYTIETPGYSNGRIDIYKQYLQKLNLTGHSKVGLPMEDGTTIIHAHNSFIQMAYDCGIITGVIFLLLYLILGLRSVVYYKRKNHIDSNAMLPVIIFAAFGISSIVEYVFRPTIPLGFVFLLMIAPLLTKFETDEGEVQRSQKQSLGKQADGK